MTTPRGGALALLIALGASGCSMVRARGGNPGPLDREGEVLVYLQPLPREAERVSFALLSMEALGPGEGSTRPLQAVRSEVNGPARTRQQLVARARLAAGSYAGLRVRVGHARVETPEGPADLLVPADAIEVAAPFTVTAGQAQVLWLMLREAQPSAADFSFVPRFALASPDATHPQRIGYCASSAGNLLVAFDRYTREVTAAVATGMAPEGVALDEAANRAYVALSLEDRIEVVDVTNAQLREPIRLRPGDSPREVGLVEEGRTLLVLNQRSNTLAFIDTASRVELGRVPVGEAPWSMRLDRARRRAYVFSRRANTVTAIDVANRGAVASAATEPEPLRGDLDRAGARLFVIHAGSAYLSVYTLPELAPAGRVFVGLGATALVVDPRTDLLYVAQAGSPSLAVFDPFSLVPLSSVDVGGAASFLTFDDAQNVLFALLPERGAVSVVDLTSQRQLGLFDVGPEPYGVTLSGERR